nr:4-hydroxyphenylpyruvate dioxygenase [Tanacetum cinerariifolium]
MDEEHILVHAYFILNQMFHKQNILSSERYGDHCVFTVKNFHHVEFWCNDAPNTACHLFWGLGMPIVSKSDLSNGNLVHTSYLLTSGEVNVLFTAPCSPTITSNETTTAVIPSFSYTGRRNFTTTHGLVVSAIAIEVKDAELVFNFSVANGAKLSSPPVTLGDSDVVLAEVKLYRDVFLRYISYNKNKNVTFLPLLPVEKTSS